MDPQDFFASKRYLKFESRPWSPVPLEPNGLEKTLRNARGSKEPASTLQLRSARNPVKQLPHQPDRGDLAVTASGSGLRQARRCSFLSTRPGKMGRKRQRHLNQRHLCLSKQTPPTKNTSALSYVLDPTDSTRAQRWPLLILQAGSSEPGFGLRSTP